MTEEWRDIDGFSRYEISNTGFVRNKKRKHILAYDQTKKNNGYQFAGLIRDDGVRKNRFAHRLVASAFIDNPDNLPQVNHKDGNKKNNAVDNLEWCTGSYNRKHAFAMGLSRPASGSKIRPVRICETGEVFCNCHDCAKNISGSHWAISACLRGHRSTHKGFHYEYAD